MDPKRVSVPVSSSTLPLPHPSPINTALPTGMVSTHWWFWVLCVSFLRCLPSDLSHKILQSPGGKRAPSARAKAAQEGRAEDKPAGVANQPQTEPGY